MRLLMHTWACLAWIGMRGYRGYTHSTDPYAG